MIQWGEELSCIYIILTFAQPCVTPVFVPRLLILCTVTLSMQKLKRASLGYNKAPFSSKFAAE